MSDLATLEKPAAAGEKLEKLAAEIFRVPLELQREIEQFLYFEASLLDDWRFRDWLELFAEDVSYVLMTNTQSQTRDRRRGVHPPLTYIFNEDKYQLERRVARLETGMAWAEEPPSRTRHLVANLRVMSYDGDVVETASNYHIHRASKQTDLYSFVGTRRDKLRRVGSTWQIFERRMELDQFVLVAPNICILF